MTNTTMTTTTQLPTYKGIRKHPFFAEMTADQFETYWTENDTEDLLKVIPNFFPKWEDDDSYYCIYDGDKIVEVVQFAFEFEYFEYLNENCHPADINPDCWGTDVIRPLGPITTPVTGYFAATDFHDCTYFPVEQQTFVTLNSVEQLEAWYNSERNGFYSSCWSSFIYWEDENGHREYVLKDLQEDHESLFGENTAPYPPSFSGEYIAGVFDGEVDEDEEFTTDVSANEVVEDVLQSLALAKEISEQGLVPSLIKSVGDFLIEKNIKIKQLQPQYPLDSERTHQLDNELPIQAKVWYDWLSTQHEQLAARPGLRIFATVLMTNQVTPLLQALSAHRDAFGITSDQMRQISCAGLELFELLFKNDVSIREDSDGPSVVSVNYGILRIHPDQYEIRSLQLSDNGRYLDVSVPAEVINKPFLAGLIIDIISEIHSLRSRIDDSCPLFYKESLSTHLRTLRSHRQQEWFESLYYAAECFTLPIDPDEEGYVEDKNERLERAAFVREFFNLGERYDLDNGTVLDNGWMVIQEHQPVEPSILRCHFSHFHSTCWLYEWTQNSREFFNKNRNEILSVPSLKAYADEVMTLDKLSAEEKEELIYQQCSWFVRLNGYSGQVHIDPKGRELHKRRDQWVERVNYSGLSMSAWLTGINPEWAEKYCFADPCHTQEDIEFDSKKLKRVVAAWPNKFFNYEDPSPTHFNLSVGFDDLLSVRSTD